VVPSRQKRASAYGQNWQPLARVRRGGGVPEAPAKSQGQSLARTGITEYAQLELDILEQEHAIQQGLETNKEKLTSDKSWKAIGLWPGYD
jgi:hypothetical protein